MPIHTLQLDDFIGAWSEEANDFRSAEARDRYIPWKLIYDTAVDQSLDPFSNEYLACQIALYREVSGRDLDQASGELHPLDVQPLLSGPNPTGSHHASDNAEQIRALSALLALARLSYHPKVLDMGAGGGLSSEVYAYAGCEVHAVDIDPLFASVARQRAAERNFEISRSILNFDDAKQITGGPYQAAFFYQSFHHCLRPWTLIADLSEKLDASAVIGFTGEPIQDAWWNDWGLRMDQESVYVARRFGWFESGWSAGFIGECFARNGYMLLLFSGGYAGSEIGLAAKDPRRIDEIRTKASLMGLIERYKDIKIPASSYATLVGVSGKLLGRPAFRQTLPAAGMLMYGPYVALEAGSYELSIIVGHQACGSSSPAIGKVIIEVIADFGSEFILSEEISASSINEVILFVRKITFKQRKEKVEFRAAVDGDGLWSVSVPEIRPMRSIVTEN